MLEKQDMKLLTEICWLRPLWTHWGTIFRFHTSKELPDYLTEYQLL